MSSVLCGSVHLPRWTTWCVLKDVHLHAEDTFTDYSENQRPGEREEWVVRSQPGGKVWAYRLRKWVSKRESIFTGGCEGKFWQSQDPKPKLGETETVVVWEGNDPFLSDLFIYLSLAKSPLSTPGQVPLGFCSLSLYSSSHGHFYLLEPYSSHICIIQDNTACQDSQLKVWTSHSLWLQMP